MDWSILSLHNKKHPFLRPELLYPSHVSVSLLNRAQLSGGLNVLCVAILFRHREFSSP
jgi:hypothetical protein